MIATKGKEFAKGLRGKLLWAAVSSSLSGESSMTLHGMSNRAPAFWSVALLLAGLVMATAVGVWQQQANAQAVQDRLDAAANHLVAQVWRRVLSYEYGLVGARSAVMASARAANEVSREDFRRYTDAFDMRLRLPGARGLGFIQRVPAAQEAAFVQQARRRYGPDFHIQHIGARTAGSTDRCVLMFLEPQQGNEGTQGRDLCSEPRRHAALQASVRLGKPQISAPVTLVQAPDRGDRSFVLVMPVYASGMPESVEQREAATLGWVVMPLVIDEVLTDLGFEDSTLAMSVSDITGSGNVERVYQSAQWHASREQTLVRPVALELFGRTWLVQAQASAAFVDQLNLRSPVLVAGGFALAFAMASLLLQASLRARQQEHEVRRQRLQLAAVVDSAHDAIVVHTPHDEIMAWNGAAERLLGWSAQEVLGRSLTTLTVPPQEQARQLQALEQVRRGEPAPPYEAVRLDRHGMPVPVRVSLAPIHAEGNGVTGIATTMHDLREQHAAQERILASNAALEAALQRLRESESSARHTANLLEQLLESAADPIWTNDLEGRMTVVNSATAAVLGQPRQALVGLHNRDVLPAAAAATVDAQDQRILQEGQTVWVEQTLFDASRGEPRVFLTIKSPLRSPDGHITGIVGIARDISERKAAEARLAELNATLEQQVQQRTAELRLVSAREHAIVTSAGSAIVTTDLAGLITSINPAAAALFRTTAQQAVGCSVCKFHDPDELDERGHESAQPVPEFAQALPRALRQALPHRGTPPGEGARRTEWTYVRADGTRVPGLLTVSLLRDAQGDVIGFLAMIADLTERRRMEDELRQRTRQAEAASQAKSAFLAHMSHELRTPLNAVIGLSQLLQQMELPPRAGHFLHHIHQAGEQLLALTNDVLDLSRIEAGEMRLEKTSFEIAALLDAVRALVQPQADTKGLMLRLDVAPDLPRQLCGDALRLKQVLINLLGNAVKFTQAGSVALRVSLLTRQDGWVRLRFEVIDTGIGIASEAQARIFDAFTQADNSTTRRFGGTGLGLSIVRRLVAMMGGELAVQSTPGQGSTFSVTLPMEMAAAEAARHDSVPALPAGPVSPPHQE